MKRFWSSIEDEYDKIFTSRDNNILYGNLQSNRYWRTSIISIDTILDNNKLNMSAVVTPDGRVMTEQAPGEEYTKEHSDIVKKHPSGEKIESNILTGQYIDSVYQKLINSKEGKAYVDFLRKTGNGKKNPGKLETIIISNEGKGVVAATLPDYVKANIIVNADYIHDFAIESSKKFNLSYDHALEVAIMHELHHYFGQTPRQLQQDVNKVEFDNDFALIKFYTGLMKEDPKNEGLYLNKTKLLRSRYGGQPKKTMDDYIEKYSPKEPQSKVHRLYPSNRYKPSVNQNLGQYSKAA